MMCHMLCSFLCMNKMQHIFLHFMHQTLAQTADELTTFVFSFSFCLSSQLFQNYRDTAKSPKWKPFYCWKNCCWLGSRKGIRSVQIWGGWWRWALVRPDGVVPSQMVSVSASVNLPLHNIVQKFSSGTGSSGWSRKTVVVVVVVVLKDDSLHAKIVS